MPVYEDLEFLGPHRHRSEEPMELFTKHADELIAVGVDAFAQQPDEFAEQLTGEFARVDVADVVTVTAYKKVIGYALYKLFRGSHWHLART